MDLSIYYRIITADSRPSQALNEDTIIFLKSYLVIISGWGWNRDDHWSLLGQEHYQNGRNVKKIMERLFSTFSSDEVYTVHSAHNEVTQYILNIVTRFKHCTLLITRSNSTLCTEQGPFILQIARSNNSRCTRLIHFLQ